MLPVAYGPFNHGKWSTGPYCEWNMRSVSLQNLGQMPVSFLLITLWSCLKLVNKLVHPNLPVQSFAPIHGELICFLKKDTERFRFQEFEVCNCTFFSEVLFADVILHKLHNFKLISVQPWYNIRMWQVIRLGAELWKWLLLCPCFSCIFNDSGNDVLHTC